MEEFLKQREKAIEEYPETWKRLVSDWQYSKSDRLWLTYSANYLLNTSGFKWAIDPYSLFTRVGGGVQPDFSEDLKDLQLVVLTHDHSDHWDLNILEALKDLPIQWVIPEFMIEKVFAAVELPTARVTIPQPMLPIEFNKLRLTPFKGLHIHGKNGVPSMGYLAEFSNKRWLFPGDTRTYNFSQLPAFGELTGVVGHLWLGKAEALEPEPSKVDDFCQFFSQLKTQQLIITHLREYGRIPEELWDLYHFEMVETKLHHLSPKVQIKAAFMGDRVDL